MRWEEREEREAEGGVEGEQHAPHLGGGGHWMGRWKERWEKGGSKYWWPPLFHLFME